MITLVWKQTIITCGILITLYHYLGWFLVRSQIRSLNLLLRGKHSKAVYSLVNMALKGLGPNIWGNALFSTSVFPCIKSAKEALLVNKKCCVEIKNLNGSFMIHFIGEHICEMASPQKCVSPQLLIFLKTLHQLLGADGWSRFYGAVHYVIYYFFKNTCLLCFILICVFACMCVNCIMTIFGETMYRNLLIKMNQ